MIGQLIYAWSCKESFKPPCPAGDDERQSGRNVGSMVDENVWTLGAHEGRLGSCGVTVLVLKWARRAFGLRGRLHVRFAMPAFMEGTVEGISDERAIVITVELASEEEG